MTRRSNPYTASNCLLCCFWSALSELAFGSTRSTRLLQHVVTCRRHFQCSTCFPSAVAIDPHCVSKFISNHDVFFENNTSQLIALIENIITSNLWWFHLLAIVFLLGNTVPYTRVCLYVSSIAQIGIRWKMACFQFVLLVTWTLRGGETYFTLALAGSVRFRIKPCCVFRHRHSLMYITLYRYL